MRVRYCRTVLQKLLPCDVGWADYSFSLTEGINSKGCHDEPMEENCNNIVNDNDLHCPYCGSKLGVSKDREPLFGSNIRGAIRILKGD